MQLRVLRLRLPIRQLQSLTTKPERSWASPEITKEQWGVRQCLWASEGKLSQKTHKFEEQQQELEASRELRGSIIPLDPRPRRPHRARPPILARVPKRRPLDRACIYTPTCERQRVH